MKPDGGLRAQLLAAAADGDDEAQMLYVDLLASRDDVRAEFIQLGRLRSGLRTRDQDRRYRESKRRWQLLVGELSGVLLKDGLRFRRGLLVQCTATCSPHNETLEVIRQSVEWLTIESLELRYGPDMRLASSLVFAPHMQRLTLLSVPDVEAFNQVLRAGERQESVRSIEVLRGAYEVVDDPNVLGVFPALDSVSIPFRPFDEHPLSEQLSGIVRVNAI